MEVAAAGDPVDALGLKVTALTKLGVQATALGIALTAAAFRPSAANIQ